MLRGGGPVGFSKRAVYRTHVRPEHAGRYPGEVRRRREGGAVRRGRAPEGAREARGEGADAREADCEADLDHLTVGRAQQGGRPLEPPGEQVRVRRLAEGAPELAAEVRP